MNTVRTQFRFFATLMTIAEIKKGRWNTPKWVGALGLLLIC